MAVTRKQAEELAQDVKLLLNRPDEDDFYQWPEEYFEALNRAQKKVRRMIAQHEPELLVEETTKTTSDSGLTYDLGDHHLGQIEVWAPPGPPTGERIPPANPDSPYFGFWVDGTDLRFTQQKEYSGGVYIRWTPATVTAMVPGGTHVLPAFCEDMLEYEAAYLMSLKTGFPGDPNRFAELSIREWKGDPRDPSDMGILGIIKRDAASRGFETAAGATSRPWYRGIS